MAKTLTTVRGGVLASKLNFRLCYNFSLNSKKTKRKGFSVAEAMIALLIGSLALGMAAPMITKQIKAQNMSDIQNRVLMQKIRELEEQIMPEGMIRFFYDRACPNGWTPITAADGSRLDGYYLRLSSSSNDNEIGTTLEPALPNIIAGFPGIGQKGGSSNVIPKTFWEEDEDKDGFYGAVNIRNTSTNTKYGLKYGGNDSAERDDYFHFDASNHNNIYGKAERELPQNPTEKQKEWARTEVRPRSVVISACRKL